MEPLTEWADCKKVREASCDDPFLKSADRGFWQKHNFDYIVREEGGFLWIELKGPPTEQLQNVLKLID